MTDKILIPYNLSFLVSSNPLQTGEWPWVQLGDSGRGCSPLCLEGSTICCASVADAQVGAGSSVLNLLWPRIRPVKTGGTGQIVRFSGGL